MRNLAMLAGTIGLLGCTNAPVTHESHDNATDAPGVAPMEAVSLDSVVEFLLATAATDFDAHRPPNPIAFRGVRLGHVLTDSGERQYMLCGQFLPAPGEGVADWAAFATVRTAPYEQWLGSQASAVCEGASVTWDGVEDLSAALWTRFSSLR